MNNNGSSIGSAGDPNKPNKTDYSNPYVRMQTKLSPSGAAAGTSIGPFPRYSLGNESRANDKKWSAPAEASGSGTIGARPDGIGIGDQHFKRKSHEGANKEYEDLVDIPLQVSK